MSNPSIISTMNLDHLGLLAQDMDVRVWLEENSLNEDIETVIVNWITFFVESHRLNDNSKFVINLSEQTKGVSQNKEYKDFSVNGHYLGMAYVDVSNNVRASEEIFLCTNAEGKIENYLTVETKRILH